MKIRQFTGEFGFLSNFYPVSINYCGRTWPSVEHAFQAMKTLDRAKQEEIRVAPTPALAKKLGRRMKLRKDWDAVKVGIMEDLVLAKFKQNQYLAEKLLATGDMVLEEGNNWGDAFWGVVDGIGRNELGKILMCVRAVLACEN